MEARPMQEYGRTLTSGESHRTCSISHGEFERVFCIRSCQTYSGTPMREYGQTNGNKQSPPHAALLTALSNISLECQAIQTPVHEIQRRSMKRVTTQLTYRQHREQRVLGEVRPHCSGSSSEGHMSTGMMKPACTTNDVIAKHK